MKPVIGVTLSASGNRLVWYAHKFAIYRAGGVAKEITAPSSIDKSVDGYVIGGGDDIGLELNGNELDPTVKYDSERDQLELDVLDHAYAASKPVLGICRGAQMINLSRGGTLYFDLSRYNPELGRRRFILPRKSIRVEEGSMLFKLLEKSRLTVNALHHQSINKLGKRLRVVAKDKEGIVQAIECNDSGNLIGVQWHPELIPWSGSHMRLFKWVVDRAKNKNTEPTPEAAVL